MLSHNIRRLRDNEIAGADTVNPIVKFLLGMKSQSEYLTINPNGMGSVNFDFDAGSILRNVMEMMHAIDLDFSFKVTISGTSPTLHVAAGTVYLPDHSVGISSYTHNLALADAEKMVYVRLNSASAGELVFDSAVTHTIQTGGGSYRVTLPIAAVSHSGGSWQVTYHHLGDIELVEMPYCYISGYDRSKVQGLMHGAGADGVKWTDAGTCS